MKIFSGIEFVSKMTNSKTKPDCQTKLGIYNTPYLFTRFV